MFAFCNIGMTKQGKSRYSRELITLQGMDRYGAFVNDPNNEYGMYRQDRDTGEYKPSVNLSDDVTQLRSRFIGNNEKMKPFLKLVQGKRNTTVIFEECTAYFKGATPAGLCEMVINKGHTHNNYVFNFHSIRSVPPELLGLMDFVTLFKTSDEEDLVKAKSQKLLPYWLDLQMKKDGCPPWKIDWLGEKPFNKRAYEDMKRRFNLD